MPISLGRTGSGLSRIIGWGCVGCCREQGQGQGLGPGLGSRRSSGYAACGPQCCQMRESTQSESPVRTGWGASTRHGEQAPGTTGGEGRLDRLSQEGGELGGAGDSHLHVLAFHMCTP